MKRQRGVALVTALLIVAIIVTVASLLALGQQVWLRQTQNLVDLSQAEMYQRGAFEFAALLLKEDLKKIPSGELKKECTDQIPLPVDGGGVVITICDAQARFSLNNITDTVEKGAYVRLLTANDIDPTLSLALSESLLDWIDDNSTTQPGGGAEDLDYMNLDPPRRAANRPLTSVDELRMIKGYDENILKKLRNSVVALPGGVSGSPKYPINVNTASRDVLMSLLNISSQQAEQVISARPFKDLNDLKILTSNLQGPASYDVKSTYFIVSVQVYVGHTQRRAEALIERTGSGPWKTEVWWYRQPRIEIKSDDDKDKT